MLEADIRGDAPSLTFSDDRPAPGLDPGSPAPDFELPDLDGNHVSLDSILARGKPVFIRHRTQNEVEEARKTDWKSLRDPQPDEDRVLKPEWLIMMGRCLLSSQSINDN